MAKSLTNTQHMELEPLWSVHITEVPGACPSSIVEFSTLSQYVSLSFQPKLLEGWVGVLVGSYY